MAVPNTFFTPGWTTSKPGDMKSNGGPQLKTGFISADKINTGTISMISTPPSEDKWWWEESNESRLKDSNESMSQSSNEPSKDVPETESGFW